MNEPNDKVVTVTTTTELRKTLAGHRSYVPVACAGKEAWFPVAQGDASSMMTFASTAAAAKGLKGAVQVVLRGRRAYLRPTFDLG